MENNKKGENMPEIEAAKQEELLPAHDETNQPDQVMLELEPTAEETADKAANAAQNIKAAAASAAAGVASAATAAANKAADAVNKAKESIDNGIEEVKANVNIPDIDTPAPIRKSGMAWLWWILAIAFIGIIILCCVRSGDGDKVIKEEKAQATQMTTSGKAPTKIAKSVMQSAQSATTNTLHKTKAEKH